MLLKFTFLFITLLVTGYSVPTRKTLYQNIVDIFTQKCGGTEEDLTPLKLDKLCGGLFEVGELPSEILCGIAKIQVAHLCNTTDHSKFTDIIKDSVKSNTNTTSFCKSPPVITTLSKLISQLNTPEKCEAVCGNALTGSLYPICPFLVTNNQPPSPPKVAPSVHAIQPNTSTKVKEPEENSVVMPSPVKTNSVEVGKNKSSAASETVNLNQPPNPAATEQKISPDIKVIDPQKSSLPVDEQKTKSDDNPNDEAKNPVKVDDDGDVPSENDAKVTSVNDNDVPPLPDNPEQNVNDDKNPDAGNSINDGLPENSNLPSDSQNTNIIAEPENLPFIEPDKPHFFVYFVFISALCIFFYVAMYNKKKILALVIEGRRSNVKRRPNSAAYSKLNCNLEEAMASGPSTSSSKTLMY